MQLLFLKFTLCSLADDKQLGSVELWKKGLCISEFYGDDRSALGASLQNIIKVIK
jgi:hypothetical protein